MSHKFLATDFTDFREFSKNDPRSFVKSVAGILGFTLKTGEPLILTGLSITWKHEPLCT
jgi:hypothetical protein